MTGIGSVNIVRHYHKELKAYHNLQLMATSTASCRKHGVRSNVSDWCNGVLHKVVLLHVECFSTSACTRCTTVTTDHVYFDSTYMSWSFHSILPTHVSDKINPERNPLSRTTSHRPESKIHSPNTVHIKDERGTTFWHEDSMRSHWTGILHQVRSNSFSKPIGHACPTAWPATRSIVSISTDQALVPTMKASQDRQPIAGQTCSQTW